MAFDRSKYKKSKSLQDQQKELVSSGKIKEKGSNGNADYFKFDKDGDYYLKFWPAHLDETGDPKSYFMVLKTYHFLKMMKDKYEDGQKVLDGAGNPVQELKTGTIFNSITHGNTSMDIITEYINFVREQGMEMYPGDKEGYKTYMKYIYGFGSGKNYVGGLKASEEYIAYASLLNKDTMQEEGFYRVVLKPSMRKAMLKISTTEDGGDGISTDPFTDPDDGFVVKITRDSEAAKKANDPSLYYDVSFYTKNYVPVKWPLPENFPEVLEKTPSLASQFENKYTAKDFQKAIEGLERFDKECGYNLFASDAWLDICEKVADQYPEEEPEVEEENAGGNAAPVAPTAQAEATETTEEVDDLPFDAPVETVAPAATGGMSAAEKLAAMKKKAAGKG